MPSLLIACGGFLAGVLWMDLLFDTQIVRMPVEQAVVVISAYYANATIEAYPLNRVIGVVMLLLAGGALWQFVRGRVDRRLSGTAALTALVPVVLALSRVVPNAVQMGMRSGSGEQQIALARAIFIDHLVCLAFIFSFIGLQIAALRTQRLQSPPASAISRS